MKANSFANLKQNKLFVAYILAGANALFMVINIGPDFCYDTISYLQAWDTIKSGAIDSLRTPVYPFFLGVLHDFFGEESYQLIAICLQYSLFLLSIRPFYCLAEKISHRFSFATTLFYSLWPGIATWNNSLMTEAFAISGIVFLLEVAYSYYKDPQWGPAFRMAFWILFLFMLRPSFIYVLPVFILLWISSIIFQRNKKNVVLGIFVISIVGGSQFYYMYCFQQRYGFFAMSYVADMNIIRNGLKYHWIQPEQISDCNIKHDIELLYAEWDSNELYGTVKERLYDKYDCNLIHQEIKNSVNVTGKDFVHVALKAWNEASKTLPMSVSYIEKFSYVIPFITTFGFGFSTINLILLIYCILLCVLIRKKKEVHTILFSMFLFVLCLCGLLTIIIGAGDDCTRLFSPNMPIICIMSEQIINIFYKRTDWVDNWQTDGLSAL